ncbi:MAG: hypothetical protein RL026_1543 [Pseudomonadota bacterium]|jgi:hypothetical protein
MNAPANSTETPKTGSRITLLLLVALFFLPVLVAVFLYFGTSWRPSGLTVHGELMAPVVTIEEGPVLPYGKWTLLHVAEGGCDDACRKALVLMRQTRLALAQDMGRVNRVFIADGTCCDRAYLETEHAGLSVHATEGNAEAARVARALSPGEGHRWVYVVDPIGNVVMRYDIDGVPKDLLTDLKKLLKLSSIG